MYRRIIFIISVLFYGVTFLPAQNEVKLSAEEIKTYEQQSKMMISYLEGTLNFLGDPDEVIAEKEIIINNSYLKVFLNPEVQIEDDLDENRDVPLRKDVQAYLKDIIFFYKKVQFAYEVISVEQITNQKGEIVFKVSVNRNLQGVTVDNDTVDNNLLRFVEINLDPYKKDLHIASIYSTKPNAKTEMRYWWNHLPLPWKDFFGAKVLVFDTLTMNSVISFDDSTAVILRPRSEVEKDSLLISGNDTLRFAKLPELDSGQYKIVYSYDTVLTKYSDTVKVNVSELDSYLKTFFGIKSIDLSNNFMIESLEPLSRLTALERVNVSNMLINDLSPLRNLNKLQELNVSRTAVKHLEPLKFSFNLKELDLSKTETDSLDAISGLTMLERLIIDSTLVVDLSPLAAMNNLNLLSLAYTPVTNLEPVGKLPALKRLILKGSAVTDLTALQNAPAIEYINIDNTHISDLSPLAGDSTLKTIQANNSAINSLQPLEANKRLKLIYCDNTGINRDKAIGFMEKNPKCLVIFDSQRLVNWWNSLSGEWKKVLSKGYGMSNPPTKEELHKIVNKKKLVLANNKIIENLEPVKMLFRLETLDADNTTISNLLPLAGLNSLRYLNLENTRISGLDDIKELTNLRMVNIDNTEVSDLKPLLKNKKLKRIYCDNTKITTPQVIAFKAVIPGCSIVYQTNSLKFWWNNLSGAWQKVLSEQIKIDGDPSREQLQQMVDLTTVTINKNSEIDDVEPLSIFGLLRELTISFTSISNLSPLSECDSIRVLNLPNNPIVDIEPLAKLTYITELDLENTGVENLEPLANLLYLEALNIAGTRVKKLKPLANLTSLRKLTINNTRVNKLTDIDELPNMEKLICYNTSIRKKKVDNYKEKHPDVKVIYY